MLLVHIFVNYIKHISHSPSLVCWCVWGQGRRGRVEPRQSFFTMMKPYNIWAWFESIICYTYLSLIISNSYLHSPDSCAELMGQGRRGEWCHGCLYTGSCLNELVCVCLKYFFSYLSPSPPPPPAWKLYSSISKLSCLRWRGEKIGTFFIIM